MRLRIVVRSLGVILVSPLIALPTGLAGGGTVAQASSARVVDPVLTHIEAPARPPEPIAPVKQEQVVEVTCGAAGCVVQDGLAVTVVVSHR